jgi:hypothetical protein
MKREDWVLLGSSCCQGNTDDSRNESLTVGDRSRRIVGVTRKDASLDLPIVDGSGG